MAFNIEWDKTGEKTYELGVDRGVLYPMSNDGTYPKGVPWNGLTTVSESPSGAEETALYADNIKYGSLTSAETYGGTIEAYQSPVEFDECDGTASLESAKGLHIHQQKRKAFGFSYRTMRGNDTADESDDGYTIHIVYGAKATPSERSYATINDSPEAMTLSWEFSTTGVNVKGHPELKPVSLLTINSWEAGADKMQKVEEALYGKDTTQPKLPLPDEIMTLLADGE